MNTRDESGMLAATTPLVTSTRPLASVWMTLMTQVLRLPFGIGSGAAKRELASSAQGPARPPHWESRVHAIPVLVPATQCLPGPAPLVQSRLLVPEFANRLLPETPKIWVAPLGVPPGGTVVAPPPP